MKSLAKASRSSTSRVVVDLIEKGLDAKDAERQHFFAVGECLTAATDKKEKNASAKSLARLTFGE